MNGRSRRWRKAVIQRLVILECELLDRRSFKTKTKTRMARFSYIEGCYSPCSRHSALGYLSPANLEAKHQATVASQSGEHGLTTVGACMAGAAAPVDNSAPALIEHPSPA